MLRRLAPFFLSLALSAPAALAEPAKALPKAFTLKGLTGGAVERQDLAGRPTVLQFFAAWCKGCGDVMAQLSPVVADVEGARFLPVSLDETMSEAKGYFKRQRPSVRSLEKTAVLDRDAKLATALEVEALPALVVVDAKGQVLLSVAGHPSASQVETIRRLIGGH